MSVYVLVRRNIPGMSLAGNSKDPGSRMPHQLLGEILSGIILRDVRRCTPAPSREYRMFIRDQKDPVRPVSDGKFYNIQRIS